MERLASPFWTNAVLTGSTPNCIFRVPGINLFTYPLSEVFV
jgi:hypothetical protein